MFITYLSTLYRKAASKAKTTSDSEKVGLLVIIANDIATNTSSRDLP